MNKTVLLGAICLLFAGCSAQYDWKREGTGAEKKEADLLACRTEMSRFGGAEARDVFDQCMQAKGYEKEVIGYGM